MKRTLMILALVGFCGAIHAEETVGEKTEATMHNTKRSMKKGMHRVEGKMCMKGDLECLKQKAANRGEETGEYIKDKSKEMKNKVDSK